MKRRPFDPRDVEGLLCFEQFNEARDALEAWKKSQRRVLKTAGDLRDMREWTKTAPRQKAVGSTVQSSRPPLVNAFLRAMARGVLTSPIWSYKKIVAAVREAGFPCDAMTLKNAKHRGKLCAVHEVTDEERVFALRISHAHPDIDMGKLVAPGSPAAAALRAHRLCDHCGFIFQSARATARYCGDACRQGAGRRTTPENASHLQHRA